MEYVIVVEADYNDADYTKRYTHLSEDEFARVQELLAKVAWALKKKPGHNWENNGNGVCPADMYAGLLTSGEVARFDRFVPSLDGEGVHTVSSVQVLAVASTLDYFK
jgi:hypothetical protein